jgi:hypothetical protein
MRDYYEVLCLNWIYPRHITTGYVHCWYVSEVLQRRVLKRRGFPASQVDTVGDAYPGAQTCVNLSGQFSGNLTCCQRVRKQGDLT